MEIGRCVCHSLVVYMKYKEKINVPENKNIKIGNIKEEEKEITLSNQIIKKINEEESVLLSILYF